MKTMILGTVLFGSMALTATMGMAGKSSAEMGKDLFNDATLGGSTNPKSCNSCHPGGEGLEKAGSKKNLSKMINRCITGPLQGSKIDGRTSEMRSLKAFIESLAGK